MPRRSVLRPVGAIVVLGSAVFLSFLRTFPPAAKPATAPAGEFSAERAIEHIAAIAKEPRRTGTPAFDKAVEYLTTQLQTLGLTTEVQRTRVPTRQWGDLPIVNLLARRPGTKTKNAVLLIAHLDTTANSPGATDDASGVAIMLETVRALKSGPPLPNTVLVLFTTEEEKGGFGAQAFVDHPWAADVKLVIEADAGGIGGPSFLAATGPEGGWLVRQYARAAPYPLASSAVEALGNPKTDYTMVLRQRGFLGFAFTVTWDRRIHSPFDSLENLKPRTIQHQGDNVLAMAQQLGNLPLDSTREPRPVYSDYLGWIVLHYPAGWAIPVFVGVSLVLGGVIWLGFRRRLLSLSGIGLGALVFLVSIVVACAAVGLVGAILVCTAPEDYASREVNFDILYWLRWGFGGVAVAAIALCYGVLQRRRKVRIQELTIGAYLLAWVAAAGTSIALKELSYVFAWPLVLNGLAVGYCFLKTDHERPAPSVGPLVGLLLAGFLTITLLLPSILTALQGLMVYEVYLGAAYVALLVGFVLPQARLALKWSG